MEIYHNYSFRVDLSCWRAVSTSDLTGLVTKQKRLIIATSYWLRLAFIIGGIVIYWWLSLTLERAVWVWAQAKNIQRCCVLWQDTLLSQCFSPPSCTSGYINNSLHLAQKYARIIVRGHYMFPLSEQIDNVRGKISWHIFAPNRGYRVYYPSNLFRNARSFENWGIFNNSSIHRNGSG